MRTSRSPLNRRLVRRETRYGQVLGLIGRGGAAWAPVPSAATISKARSRLGAEPVTELFATVRRPVAAPRYRGARCTAVRGWSRSTGRLQVPDAEASADVSASRPVRGGVNSRWAIRKSVRSPSWGTARIPRSTPQWARDAPASRHPSGLSSPLRGRGCSC
ncbi:hypothetical protein DMB66_38935 [Actinoplanes sp. ATCC 53533]|nr:hypothetical protein DMB66_38935 [Actinoplanes sp. ATCC 53533]